MPSSVPPRGGAALEFVIVGAQRAGSTHLVASLAGHPDLALCRDEVPYFEDPFYGNTPSDALARVFRGAQPGQLRGIHRPEYLARPEVPPRIHAGAPEAKILAVLRDPVARAVSAYHWYIQFGRLPMWPAEEGLGRLLDGWSSPEYPYAGDIIEFGFYGKQLRRYVELFDPDQVLALRVEQLRDERSLARVLDFLGVRQHPIALRRGPTNAGAYHRRRLAWLRLRRSLAFSWDGQQTYTYRPRRLRQPVRSAAAAAVVGLDRVVLSRLYPDGPPVLSPALEQRLREPYQDDVALLEALLGWDLSHWRLG